MSAEAFFEFMRKRHAIYLRRKAGVAWPWTDDEILRKYKFTNVYRELDRVTLWMRQFITDPMKGADNRLMLFNCALFRFIGAPDPWVNNVLPFWTKEFGAPVRQRYINAINRSIGEGQQVFTGAYIISNMGIIAPKSEIVIQHILQPLWREINHQDRFGLFHDCENMQVIFDWLHTLPGFGGNGFMAYEVVSDLRWTSFYRKPPADRRTWANAGPGARRGLNRIHGRDLEKRMSAEGANEEMQALLEMADEGEWPNDRDFKKLEMREIEHSLCEFDKYERVRLGQGKPRSIYRAPK